MKPGTATHYRYTFIPVGLPLEPQKRYAFRDAADLLSTRIRDHGRLDSSFERRFAGRGTMPLPPHVRARRACLAGGVGEREFEPAAAAGLSVGQSPLEAIARA